MFRIFSLMLLVAMTAALLSHTVPAFAAAPEDAPQVQSAEVWRLLMARTVAFQPGVVGFETYAKAFGMKYGASEHANELMRAAATVREWPKYKIEGETLVMTDRAGHKAVIKLANPKTGEVTVNDRTFKMDEKKPLLPQVKEFFKNEPKPSAGLFSPALLPTAFAQNEDGYGGGFIVGVGAGAPLLSVGFASLTVGAATATGALVAGGVVATAAGAGAIYCGFSAMSGSQYSQSWEGKTFWDRLANCSSAPLTLLGINPRDRLYLSDLKCDNFPGQPKAPVYASKLDFLQPKPAPAPPEEEVRTIHSRARSSTGHVEDREFVLKGGKLQKIVVKTAKNLSQDEARVSLLASADGSKIDSGMSEEGAPNGTAKLSRPKDAAILDQTQGLIQDFQYYNSLCANPEQKNLVMRGIERGSGVRATDKVAPEQLNKSAQ